MIIIDSREKNFNHIKDYFDVHRIPFQVEKLETGDYFNTDNPSVLVDRKANLDEICGNLIKGKSRHARFTRECQRAFKDRVRFIVLIEGTTYTNTEEIKTWKSYFSKYDGRWLANEMFRLTMAYGVEWKFSTRQHYGRKLVELLERYE